MQISQITFDDHGAPSEIGIRLSVEHAAQLVEHCGALTGHTGSAATSELYDLLEQKLFLPYWPDGVSDYRDEQR